MNESTYTRNEVNAAREEAMAPIEAFSLLIGDAHDENAEDNIAIVLDVLVKTAPDRFKAALDRWDEYNRKDKAA